MVRGEPDVAVYTDATVSQVLNYAEISFVTLLTNAGSASSCLDTNLECRYFTDYGKFVGYLARDQKNQKNSRAWLFFFGCMEHSNSRRTLYRRRYLNDA